MMRAMASRLWYRAALVCAMSVGFAVLAEAPVAAATPALRADVGIGRRIDVAAFERSVALTYDLHFRRIVAADIDRDGDLDVVAATDRTLMFWVNDGAGHLTSQPPAQRRPLDDCESGA